MPTTTLSGGTPARLLALTACLVALVVPAAASAAAPANDDMADAVTLTGENPTATGTNVDATAEEGEPGHYFGNGSTAYDPIASVWWKWTVPSSGTYVFDLCDSTFDVAFAMYEDDGTPDGFSRYNNDECGRQEHVTRFWTAGTKVLLAVDGVAGATGTVDLEITKVPPPDNDDLADARTLSGPVDSDGAPNAGATAEPGEPAHAGQAATASVWWKWVAPSNGTFVIDACQPGAWVRFYSHHVAVYTQSGSGVAGLELVAQDRESRACGGGSPVGVVPFAATMGETYYIAVDNRAFEVDQEAFANVRPQAAPPNDDFADATVLDGSTASVTADLRDATAEAGEPSHVPSEPAARSVWWKVTVPQTDDFHLAFAADFSSGWALYEQSGSGFAGLEDLHRTFLDQIGRTRDHAADYYTRLEAGTTYYVAVDGDGDSFDGVEAPGGNVSFQLAPIPAPPNDDFADAEVLEGADDASEGSTRGATPQASEPSNFGDEGTDRTVWFKWTAPSAGAYVIDVCTEDPEDPEDFLDDMGDLGVYVQNGAGLAGLAAVPRTASRDCDGDDDEFPLRYEFTAVAGKTYFALVDGANDNDAEPFDIRVHKFVRPVNDDFADARLLQGATDSDTGTNVEASVELDEDTDHADGPGSVWWKWTAPAVGRYVIETCGSHIRTELRTYHSSTAAPTVGELQLWGEGVVASPDCGRGGSRLILDNGTAGKTYWFAVDGQSFEDAGPVEISVRPSSPPANDDFADAAQLTGIGASGSASTIEATVEEEEPRHYGSAAGRSVWWKWTAPATQDVILDGCGSGYGAAMAVYTAGGGGTIEDLTPVASNTGHEDCVGGSRITLAATAGTEYFIAMASDHEDEGTVRVAILDAEPPANDDFADAAVVPAAGGTLAGDNLLSTRETAEESEPLLGDNSVWWRWTPTRTGRWALDNCSPDNEFWNEPEVFKPDGAGLAGLERLPIRVSDCGRGYRGDFVALAGRTYYIRVASDSSEGNLELVLRAWEQPANDDFADAEQLTGQSDSATATNLDASAERGEPEHLDGATRSVWWKWTAPTGGEYRIATDCSPVRLGVRAYTGPGLRELTSTGTRLQEVCATGAVFGLRFAAQAGRTYFIAVDAPEPDSEPFELTLQRLGGGDLTPPETTIDSGPAEGAVLDARRATFTYSSDEADSTFECRLIGLETDFTACDSGTITYPDLLDGSYRFEVRAIDAVGNRDDSAATRSFTVDSGDPPPPDGDGDGVADAADNCPAAANADQADADGDGIGDACDTPGPGGGGGGGGTPPGGTPPGGTPPGGGVPPGTLPPGGGGASRACPAGTSPTVTCAPSSGGGMKMTGTAAAETFVGTSEADVILGGGGKDRARGGDGNDRISGGAGNDRLSGGDGNDRLSGGSGNDRLTGGKGKDRFRGGAGNDRIDAKGQKRERVACGAGRDIVKGARGDLAARDCERGRPRRR